jgi:hypothetical protein
MGLDGRLFGSLLKCVKHARPSVAYEPLFADAFLSFSENLPLADTADGVVASGDPARHGHCECAAMFYAELHSRCHIRVPRSNELGVDFTSKKRAEPKCGPARNGIAGYHTP